MKKILILLLSIQLSEASQMKITSNSITNNNIANTNIASNNIPNNNIVNNNTIINNNINDVKIWQEHALHSIVETIDESNNGTASQPTVLKNVLNFIRNSIDINTQLQKQQYEKLSNDDKNKFIQNLPLNILTLYTLNNLNTLFKQNTSNNESIDQIISRLKNNEFKDITIDWNKITNECKQNSCLKTIKIIKQTYNAFNEIVTKSMSNVISSNKVSNSSKDDLQFPVMLQQFNDRNHCFLASLCQVLNSAFGNAPETDSNLFKQFVRDLRRVQINSNKLNKFANNKAVVRPWQVLKTKFLEYIPKIELKKLDIAYDNGQNTQLAPYYEQISNLIKQNVLTKNEIVKILNKLNLQDKNLKDNNINLINNFLRQIHYYSNSFNFFNSDTAQSVNDAMTKISTIFQDYTKITQENNDPVIYHNEIVEDSVPLLINGNMQKVMINNDDIKKSISNYQNPDQLFLGSEVKYQYAKNVASSIINHQFFPIVNLSKNKLKIAVYQLKGVTIRNQTPSTAISQGGHFYSIVNINNQWKLANTLPYCIQSGSSLSALYPSSSNNIIPAINLACYEKCNQEIEINL